MDCRPPDSSVHEIFQARVLEWVAVSYSRGSFQLRDQTHVFCGSSTAGRFFTCGVCGFSSVQFSSVSQSCPTLCDPLNRSTPSLPVHHQLPESTKTHVHRVGDAIRTSHPLSSPSPPGLNLSQHQCLFKSVSSSHQVAKVLELQLQHQVISMNIQD